jgi:site-specific DNA-methyltransferase (adenine-specific)
MISHVENCDNLDFMQAYPDGFFDLGVFDPPFGGGIMAKNKFQRHKNTDSGYRNKSIPPKQWYDEIDRVCKNTIIFGCQYQMEYLNPNGSFIVWDKKADPDLHNMSSCDIAWYSKRERIRTFRGHWCGAVKCETEPTIHIHQKPIKLYKWLLTHYAESGFKILDTHLGSGSSRIAAHQLGFDFYGCEVDEKHFNDQEKRYNNHIKQQSLLF